MWNSAVNVSFVECNKLFYIQCFCVLYQVHNNCAARAIPLYVSYHMHNNCIWYTILLYVLCYRQNCMSCTARMVILRAVPYVRFACTIVCTATYVQGRTKQLQQPCCCLKLVVELNCCAAQFCLLLAVVYSM